jgi:hypothetical protein
MKSYVRNLAIIWFFIILVIPSFTISQVKEEELRTQGWDNGNYWKLLSKANKIFYLRGAKSGIALFASELIFMAKDKYEIDRILTIEDQLMIKGVRYDKLAQQVDKFYETHSNIRIPIAYAYFFVTKKMSGTKLKDLDEYVIQLRKTWNK